VTGRGRPSTGVKVQVRIPADLLAEIDVEAEQRGMTRAAYIRMLVDGVRPYGRSAAESGGPPVD
jgi:hypothetical protein